MWGSQPKGQKVKPEKGKDKPLEKGEKGKLLEKGKALEKGKPLGKGEEEWWEEGEWVWKPFLNKYKWVKSDHNRAEDKQWFSLAEQNSPETVEGLEEQKDKPLEKAEKRKLEESSASSQL